MTTLRLAPTRRILSILGKALEGHPPEREEAYELMWAQGPDLQALLKAASALRDRYKGRVITYSRKVFIPLTNLCRDSCAYCTFVRRPGQAGAHTMSEEEVLAVARAGALLGCKEALFSLGDKPELRYSSYRRWLAEKGYRTTLEYVRDMCAMVVQRTGLLPHANPGAMTEEDVRLLRPYNVSMGLMLESVSLRLLRPGMPHHRCPDKVPRLRLATIEAAGRQKVAFTTGILVGIGETPQERVDSLLAIRQLHERYGHVQEVIVQNFRAKPDIPMWDHPEPSLEDMLRTLAVARLLLQDMNIQAPPNLAPRQYRLYLHAGINDWGGISPLTQDFINPEAPWPKLQEVREVCRQEGFELRERLPIYPEYVHRREFVPEGLWGRVQSLVDETGLVRRDAEGPY
jgi:FO synthase subunit 1